MGLGGPRRAVMVGGFLADRVGISVVVASRDQSGISCTHGIVDLKAHAEREITRTEREQIVFDDPLGTEPLGEHSLGFAGCLGASDTDSEIHYGVSLGELCMKRGSRHGRDCCKENEFFHKSRFLFWHV